MSAEETACLSLCGVCWERGRVQTAGKVVGHELGKAVRGWWGCSHAKDLSPSQEPVGG